MFEKNLGKLMYMYVG